MKSYLVVKSYSKALTINANTSGLASIEQNVPSGYTPVGIVEVDHTGNSFVRISKFSVTNSRVYATVFNTYSQKAELTVTVKVLYQLM